MRSGSGRPAGRKARLCRNQLIFAAVLFVVLQSRTAWRWVAAAGLRRSFSRNALPPGASRWAQLTHLVIVCGHAVLTTHEALTQENLAHDKAWALEPFQKGQVGTFVAHIEKGIELAARDERALLLFSGGMTRSGAGPRSESQSYWEVADALNWRGTPAVRERALTEDHAHDSLENVLFSLCRFREVTGRYPERISLVSFDFKRTRFETMHRRALRWPLARFTYAGVDPAGGVSKAVRDGELLNSAALFEHDPYGCLDPHLTRKREQRNPFHDVSGYPKECPELEELFEYCSDALFPGALPWEVE